MNNINQYIKIDWSELKNIIETFFDQNIDEMAQMYLDAFTADELITMLDFEMTPLAKKKLDITFKLQKFITDGIFNFMMEKQYEEDAKWNKLKEDIETIGEEIKEEKLFVWDTKE